MIKEIKNLFIIITVDNVNNCMLWLYFFVVIQALLKNSGVFCFLYFLT